MPRGLPSVGRQSYVRIKLQQDTHASWIELKEPLKLKRDNTLACYLSTSVEQRTTVGRVDNSTKV